MADKRINALTTTATSTASDDFIAVDGTTNGTRKLNAYSPTFGGNATVTGTLTVNSASTITTTGATQLTLARSSTTPANIGWILGADNTGPYIDTTQTHRWRGFVNGSEGFYCTTSTFGIPLTTASTSTSTGALVVSGGIGVAGATYSGGTIRVLGSSHTTRIRFDDAIIDFSNTAENAYVTGTISGNTLQLKGNNGTGLTIGTTGNVSIASTTASTSTSTGALVVSGGVGVAGVIHGGNNIRATGNLYAGDSSVSTGAVSIQIGDSRTGSGYAHLDFIGDTTYSDYGLRLIRGDGGANTTSSLLHRGTGALQIVTEEAASILLSTASTTALTITSAQQVQVNATTASTSTSTGALVVSGGVGVAGALYIGGLIESSDAAGIRVRTASGTAAKLSVIQTGNATWEMQSIASSSDFAITANSTTDAFRVTTAGNATLAGSVKTSAPSGGTAAAWKLGTVASVSPTSPNRTIEVDIGGTIYYIHAKTTNN
jgi:hypothetical protein